LQNLLTYLWCSSSHVNNRGAQMKSPAFDRTQRLFILVCLLCLLPFPLPAQFFSVQRVVPVPPRITSIISSDSLTLWAVGEKGTVIKSTDGGVSWLKTVSGTDKTLRTICFVDDTTGFAAGDASVIIYTSNGGLTWSPLTSPVSGMKFYSIHF